MAENECANADMFWKGPCGIDFDNHALNCGWWWVCERMAVMTTYQRHGSEIDTETEPPGTTPTEQRHQLPFKKICEHRR